jgi:hypothetical protein
MTQWSPVWKVIIAGVEYTDAVLANLTITTGRNNIYEQAQPGYCNIQLIDVNQVAIPVSINSVFSVQIKDVLGDFVSIFNGTVVDIGLEVRDVGSTMFTQTYNITALGPLARLPKALTDGVLTKDFDGNQILSVLTDLLVINWSEVSSTATWGTYDPTTTWTTVTGIGEIDTPGNYELAGRSSSRTNVYSLVSGLATSGLGYLYELDGVIGYADSTHRSTYLNTYGYVELSANNARAAGIRTETRAGDVRNVVTIQYKAGAEQTASDADSIATYGSLGQIITTSIEHAADAISQADYYLQLRKDPQAIFSRITYDLTNPELDNFDRDNLINTFMGLPLAITDLPLNMGSIFQGFVEGWSFQAGYNTLSISLNLSPTAYSFPALQWDEVSSAFDWAGVSPTLDWTNATIVT